MRRTHQRTSNTTDLADRLAIAAMMILGAIFFVAVLKILLPWLLMLAAIALAFHLWTRRRQRGRALQTLFYDLIQRNQGRISVLEFAIAAQITGTAARTFLDARAREFFAEFEPTQQGDITYVFSLPKTLSKS